jgi:hypothetical protein
MVTGMNNEALARSGRVRRSKTNNHFCVECIHPHRPSSEGPRYCICASYRRDPTLREQCLRCFRRIHPSLDHEAAA